MASGYFRRPTSEGETARPANTIQIYLKHHNDPEGRFAVKHKTCQDYETPGGQVLLGCGGSIVGYKTYPREKSMYFDGDPIVVQQFPPRQDGAVIAVVRNDNVHWATCPARNTPRDSKLAAAGV